ncbi:putative proteasome subunit beta type-2 [Ditylenchus destructor]|nr:putative proteasome subunit beta type-2 [Ditylenchus destructor]
MEFQPAAFDFSLCKRNLALQESGMSPMKAKSTGTTIMRAPLCSVGTPVLLLETLWKHKFCMKVHKLTNSINARGAGTAADLDQVCNMLSANMRLQELNFGRKARVISQACEKRACGQAAPFPVYGLHRRISTCGWSRLNRHIFVRYLGKRHHYGQAFCCARLRKLQRHERNGAPLQIWNDAGMYGDNVSGNTFNLVTIDKDGARFEGPIVPDFSKTPSIVELQYKFPAGAAKVLKQKTIKYEVIESMDTN